MKFIKILAAIAVATILPLAPAQALTLQDAFSGQYRGDGQPTELFSGPDAIVPKTINLLLFIVGILAVFMIIYGGIRYVLSGGDSKKVTDAKNTVLYAIVGLVVAIVGYSFVNWVSQMLSGDASNSGGGMTSGDILSFLVISLV